MKVGKKNAKGKIDKTFGISIFEEQYET